mgnify:FL=1|jgi:hypothetical protein|tara:strand:+ start:12 stop:179 length:168 start_codon:yes stop_codon:yes gene_type:complete
MKQFEKLLKEIFNPGKSTHKILRYKFIFKTQKEKDLYIADCVEMLNSNIKLEYDN